MSSLHCLPATAKTCCTPLCDVAPVGHRVQRQGEVAFRPSHCDSLAFRRSPLFRIPTTFWTLFIASPKALTMRRRLLVDLLRDGRFPTGRQPSARQGTLRVCAHLSIPIATHLHTRHVGPIVTAEGYSAVVLGRKKRFFGCVVVQLWCLRPPRGHALPHRGARRLCC